MKDDGKINIISLFIFKSNARGMQYGMGTYIKELTHALSQNPQFNIFLISYLNKEYKEYSIEKFLPNYFWLNFPSPKIPSQYNSQFERKYSSFVVKVISDFIPKNGKVVFQMNSMDDLPLIMKLKEKYSYPIISMVHFAQWQQMFNGNKQRLGALNIDKPTHNEEYTLFKERESYQVADHIVSVTGYMKDFLIEYYGIAPNKIKVIPNGIDFTRFHTISKKEKNNLKFTLGFAALEKIILFSGRIDKTKGIHFLLDAFYKACKKSDVLRLVIIGDGNIQECLGRYNSYYGKITFTGFLPLDQLIQFYQVADVGIVPSIFDHCPYTVLEMMAFNIPLVLSRINGLNEMLDDNQCVFINPIFNESGELTFNTEEIADVIISLANNEEKAKEITSDYPRLMSTKFSSSRMAEDMFILCKRILQMDQF